MATGRIGATLIVILAFTAAGFAQQTEQKRSQEAPDYSQEPFVIEQFRTSTRFDTDGTGRRELTARIRVQTEAGVQQLGQLVFGYNSANERMEIGYVRVRKADGSVVTAPAEAIQDLTAPIAREAPVYTDYRQKHTTVAALRPGEILEYSITTHLHTPLAPGHFWLEHNFEKDLIVLDEQLEVNVPQDRAIKLKTQPGAEPTITDEGGRRIYRWTSSHRQRESEEEAKKKKPPRQPQPPAVQLTTFQSWEEVGRWYGQLERDRIAPTDEIRAKAAELVRDRAGELDKIEALYDYVAKSFRYVSLSFGLGRYQPHPAAEIFANQYGDCKDKHTLLAALLEAVGRRAYPALIHSARKIDPDVPSPSQFDHLISAIPVGNDYIWLDTTTEVAPFRLLSANLRKRNALVIPRDAGARLVETPADPPFPNTQRVEMEGQVSELGKLNARVRYTLRGDSELPLRLAFRRTPQAQRKQLVQWVAIADGLRGEVSEVKASDPGATREPFQFEFQISQPTYLDWSSKKSQLALPLPAVGLPDADEDDVESSDPLELGTPLEVTTQLKLELPPKYAARAPVPVTVSRDYADYHSNYKVQGTAVTAERSLRFRLHELPAARTRDYLAFVRAVRTDEGQTLSLESTLAGTPAVPETAKAGELHEAGLSALQNGNFPAAVELFKRVLEIEPKHKRAWYDLGRAYLAMLQWERGVTALRKQIELNPYDGSAHNSLGLALWQLRKFDEAADAFRKQIEINPLDRAAHAGLGMVYLEMRKYAEAVPALEKAVALRPTDPLAHVSLGQAYLNVGQTDKALEAFDKAVELAPIPTVWNNVAYQLSLKKVRLDRAQQYAESAVAATAAALRNVQLDRLSMNDLRNVSGLAAYWDTLGWVHFQRGDLEKAEQYIYASWLLDQHGEVGDHLAQIYEKRGEKEKALRTYAQALAATRPVPETHARLAALVGGKEKVEALVSKAGPELSEMRTVKLGKLSKEAASAEYFVVLAPGPKLEEVGFVSGSDKLRPFAEAFRSVSYPVAFPDETPTKLVRRGILSCSGATGECSFVLLAPESVTSVN